MDHQHRSRQRTRGSTYTITRESVRRRLVAIAVATAALTAATTLPASATPTDRAPSVTGDARVDRLLARMTLDEKLSMLAGQQEAAGADNQQQAGYLPGVPRLGIPSLKLTDGPPGVITKQDSTGMTATMGLAATFSRKDARSNGVVIGRDAKALGQDVVLEPFVNMDRDTSWSRGFNTFGEDPLLTGQTGAAQIRGIQSQGTMAQVKHYIAYDGGTNVSVDAQTLHEVYLRPFADAVDAGVSSVMCSYNVINNAYSCGNSQALTSILRNQLGFKGFVTSDWGANHATTYLNAGLDMEMPGGGFNGLVPSYFSASALKGALADGSIKETRVTEAVGRILYEYDRFGLLDGASKHTITPEPRSADERVVLKTAEDAATLLKNDVTLPLTTGSSIALIGPGAGQTIATDGGGEKSGGIVSEQIGTYQALRAEKPSARLDYAVGDDMTGTAVPASAFPDGLTRSGGSVTDARLDFTTAGHNALPAGSTTSWTGTLNAPESGTYWLNIQALGATGRLIVDGRTLTTVGVTFFDQARYGIVRATDGNGPLPTTDGLANGRTKLALAAGPHTISVTAAADASAKPVQIRLNWVTPTQAQADHDASVATAKRAKTAVVFAWSEGDLSKPLPEGQDQLISDIAAVNPNTVVVLNTSQPVAMPWLSKVRSVLEMWYPGDEGGWATANVLLGKVNPGGRLPFTWPASLDQELAHQPATHPERTSAGVGGNPQCQTLALNCPLTTYSEGVNVGYRFYEATGETPLYAFGYGLSYTCFRYTDLRTAKADNGGLTVRFQVTNTGTAAGDAVPQVYLGAPETKPAGVRFAPKALAGYGRVHLAPGQSRTVTIHVPRRQLQFWSTTTSGWTTAKGARPLYVATDARTVRLGQTVTIK
jgi:beta-glucosidase